MPPLTGREAYANVIQKLEEAIDGLVVAIDVLEGQSMRIPEPEGGMLGVVTTLQRWCDENHRGPWRFCDEQPCASLPKLRDMRML